MALDLSALRRIIADENRLLTGADIPAEYQSDVLGRVHGSAEALAFPLSTEEVSALLRYAHEHRVPVTPRGAGTNLVGSTVPLEGGIILDLSRMDRVLELDEDTMTVTVEPGMLLQDLQAYVEARGLFYPPDPGEKASSIGGNISTNAGGMRAVKYGVTRDYVRGLEVVLADGTVMQVGGKQVKDASGLSLKHLLIGSEGTLAVITKCLLRLVPKPEASLSVLVPYADLKTGIQSVLTILRANANPTAVEFMERKVVALGERFCGVSYPRPDAGSYILLTFDGRSEEVTANAARVRSLALQTARSTLSSSPTRGSALTSGACAARLSRPWRPFPSRSRSISSCPSAARRTSSASSTTWKPRAACRWSASATRATAMCTCASCAASGMKKRGSASCTKTWTGPMPKPIASAASPPASTASGYRSVPTSCARRRRKIYRP